MSYTTPRDIVEGLFYYVGIADDGPNRKKPGTVVGLLRGEALERVRQLRPDDLRDVAPWFLKQLIGSAKL